MADNIVGEEEIDEDDPWGAAIAEQTQAEELQKKTHAEEMDSQVMKAQAAQSTVFKDFAASDYKTNAPNDIDFILDIPVQLTVELGRTKIAIKNLLQLAQGSVVELEGMAGEPMDVLVNGCLIAQGEVVVVNDKFGIRLTDIITPAERIRKINR
ncbi:flagellar motor switch protein FliN [Herbaspirillum sp. RTI4]|uniref:flagellar motor switch protein FliN n=1 Tax=Herbaspirillum sp. RTI4 TaxID=3048640 RepID=UPI002AB49BAC|nr:flagellar motor switch protein FliN [Herbaspirillum sp. RTI4]MDY7578311.1 flagellar motor switch protein FliN [Herbaspirillum sp. RTI4]MEA9981196.1 flagellar motor switch protein FliN [Herbaspirillum sp. RTI4]